MKRSWFASPPILVLAAAACGGGNEGSGPGTSATATPSPSPSPSPSPTPPPATASVTQRTVASFDNPWAMVFLPDGRMLVTEKPGRLQLVTVAGAKTEVSGVQAVAFSGQLGLQDVVLDPQFASNNRIWMTFAEASGGGQRLAVARATLNAGSNPGLTAVEVVWRASPSTSGGHLGARIAFSPNGQHLYVTSGDRQQGSPAQDMGGTLGKIVRLAIDGSAAPGNPFSSDPAALPEIWSLGHRNPYGLVFASDGRLFSSEMGPAGGDEFNLIEVGENYGWPLVSEGDNYDGSSIPRHATNSAYRPPLVSWTPSLAPSGMIQYRGTRFVGWTGDFILGGLAGQAIVRVRVTGNSASEIGRINMGARIREIEEAPDGRIWVLQDGSNAGLIELTPE